MTWLACVLIGAGLTAVAWLAATYPWRKPQPMPPLDVPGLPEDGHGTLTPLQRRHLERIEDLYDLLAPEPVYKQREDG